MKTIYYSSESIVKQILGCSNNGRSDKKEVGKNLGLKTSIEGALGNKIKFIADFLLKGNIEGSIVRQTNEIIEMDKFDYGKDLLKNYDCLNILGHIDKNFHANIIPGYYTFDAQCSLEEYFVKENISQILVTFFYNRYSISGNTSVNNWVSESYLNNLLIIGKASLEGIVQILDVTRNEKIDNIIAQFILIGEKGLLGND